MDLFTLTLRGKSGTEKECRGLRIDRLEQFLVPIETVAQEGEKDRQRIPQKSES